MNLTEVQQNINLLKCKMYVFKMLRVLIYHQSLM